MAKEIKNVTDTAKDAAQDSTAIVTQQQAVAFRSDDSGLEGQLLEASNQYCSFVPKTDADRITLYNIMNNPEKTLKDCINMPIAMRYLFMEEVVLVNEKTGEREASNRIVIIDENLVGYSCVSTGVFSSLRKICSPAMFGDPSGWTKPITVVPKMIAKSATKNILTLVLPPK